LQLPVRGHPLHTRSLTLVVGLLASGRWHARGDVIDLRKCGFVPMMSDIQPAGIIHQMSIDLDLDPGSGRIDRIDVAQPFVAIEPSPASGGECCRDPAPRLQALAGERLDGEFARRLGGVFGGPLGCSHLLTLFQLMSSGLQRAMQLEAALGEGAPAREPGDRLFRRSVFVEGFEGEDQASIEMAVQLADFHTRPIAPDVSPSARLAGQWDARVFARAAGTARTLRELRAARRARSFETIGTAAWHDESDRLAPLEGVPMVPGLAKRLFAIFDRPDDRLLLDATLQLAPGYIQVMAAVMDRWLAQAKQGGRPPDLSGPSGRTSMSDAGNIGGMPDSCYMWRSDGPMASMRAVRQGDPAEQAPEEQDPKG
jgi:hypothetical protein